MTKKSDAKPASELRESAEAGAPAADWLWIVNPAGALHQATREHARERFRSAGWRRATDAEIAELGERAGHQVWDDPIARPWAPEADVDADV